MSKEIEPASCLSACVLAFAGGKYRYYQKPLGLNFSDTTKSRLGGHQFFVSADATEEQIALSANAARSFGIEMAQVVLGVETAFLAEMDIDPLLLTLASSTSSSDIHVLSEKLEAFRFKLALPENREPEWEFKFLRSGLYAAGHGSSYDVAVWCPSQRASGLSIAVNFNAPQSFGKDRVTRYQYYLVRNGSRNGRSAEFEFLQKNSTG